MVSGMAFVQGGERYLSDKNWKHGQRFPLGKGRDLGQSVTGSGRYSPTPLNVESPSFDAEKDASDGTYTRIMAAARREA